MPPLLTPEQDNIRKAVHDFADRRLADGYLARAKSSEFPWELHRGIAELGALGLLAGEKYNALGTEDYVTVGLVIEELAAADFNMANAVIPVMLMSSLLAAHAEPEVQDTWLPRLVQQGVDRVVVALGLGGGDLCGVRAHRTGSGFGCRADSDDGDPGRRRVPHHR